MKRVMGQKNFFIKHKVGCLFTLLFLFVIGFSLVKFLPIYAVTKPGAPGKSEGGTGDKSGDCSGTICYSMFKPYAGVSWVLYNFDKMGIGKNDRDHIPYSRFLTNTDPTYPTNNSPTKLKPGDNEVYGCGKSSGVYIFVYNFYNKNTKEATGAAALPLYYKNYLKHRSSANYNVMRGKGNRKKDDEVMDNYTYKDRNGTADPIEVEKWNRGEFSWFCTRDTVIEEEQPIIPSNTTCSQLPGNFGAYYKGSSAGDSGVVNHSYSGTLNHNSWQKNYEGKNYVFAKPGDRVQFYETFCFPVQQVGIQTGSSRVRGQAPASSKFQIFAEKNGNQNNKYNFGDSKLHDGQYHTIGNGNPTPFTGSGITNEEYGFTAYSPTQNASSTYACETNYYRIYAPKLTVGYQIPGFTDYQYGCKSADKTGSTTEVGTVISQGIRYNDLRAWYNEYTNWTGETDSAGRPAENADRYKFNSFDEAYDINDEDTMWGSQSRKKTAHRVKVGTEEYGGSCDSNGHCTGVRTRPIYEIRYTYSRLYPDSMVNTTSQGENNIIEKKSSVYTPYNFNTSIHSYIESSEGGVGFLGARINIGANYGATPRANELISKAPYATHTREDQTVKVYEMIVDENYPESKLQEQTIANGNICHGSGIDRCKLVDTVTGRINSAGKYTGEFLNTETYERTIPDDLPGGGLGKKYCTRSVIWPASSHDSDSNTVENNMSGSAMNGGNNLHHVSAASCVTIAKKPNFQILGGGIYTNGSIITSVSNKAVGGGLGAYPSAATKLFGSWTEFGALAAGKVNGFGTGAIQGYEENYNFNLPNGGADSASDQIALSPLTISNDNKSGESNITRIGSAVLARLKARFRDTIARNSGNTIYSLTSDKTSAKNYLGLSQLYHQGDTSLSAMNSTANFYQFDHAGNLIARSNTTGEKLMNTLAMFVDGTLTIDRNINIAHETYNAVDDFPQVLIFAKKINITSNVTNIDAWLILDEDYGDNQIDTCSDNHYPNALSCNETLTITGPVFARKLILNRTAGSHTGGGRAGAHPLQTGPTGTYYAEGSIHPAEVFTLRADAYFWAYRQSLSGGQAYMVYSREIAPRY